MEKDNNIDLAFEMLQEEIDRFLEEPNKEIIELTKEGKYGNVQYLSKMGKEIGEFKEKVRTLFKEWKVLNNTIIDYKFKNINTMQNTRAENKKLGKGLKKSENAYTIPILESLVELGGSAPPKLVLDKVHDKTRNILNSYDYEPISSSNEIRWRNTARWCRYNLVSKALLKDDSPLGVWEISDKGRRWLEEQKSKINNLITRI